jgi:F0F1-type ATP synthase membrane subunit b/b'
MTPEERFDRLESVTKMLVNKGRKLRSEWREQSQEQAEKINILIHMQMRVEAQLERMDAQIASVDAQIASVDAQIASLAVAQAELTKSQKLTDRALRAFINSLRKGQNGNS